MHLLGMKIFPSELEVARTKLFSSLELSCDSYSILIRHISLSVG
jgi:hypothetical protein